MKDPQPRQSAFYALALHGGAGTILRSEMSPALEAAYTQALAAALAAGEARLRAGEGAVEAVTAAVQVLEDSPLFNAGRGAVYQAEGKHELEASIMRGWDSQAGAVAMVQGVRNPVVLARHVMESSPHVMLAGVGAEAFARAQALEMVDAEWFHTDFRYQQWQAAQKAGRVQLDHSRNMGTVGAVARDCAGHLAAATSTGGMTNKAPGRIGDTAHIGAGTWAEDATCAVSCTGHGEYYIRGAVAHDVACLMAYRGLSLAEACREVIHHKQPALGGSGGLVAVDAAGQLALPFNSPGMYRAWVRQGEKPQVAIYGE